MITMKQLDAICRIVEQGSFEAAAVRLNTSQSAISKRIQELEDAFGIVIFDRSRRSARLTDKGEELYRRALDILDQRDALLEQLSSNEVQATHYRLGVTELTALTWLPALVERVRDAYPRLALEPSIELGSQLFKKLEDDQLDMIIVQDRFNDPRYVSMPLAEVENAWMCAPGYYQGQNPMPLQALAEHMVLIQGTASGTGQIVGRWLAEHGVRLNRSLISDYLIAQVGLAIAGMGLSYLPRECLGSLIAQGRLKVVDTEPALPAIRYSIVHRADRLPGLSAAIKGFANEACDYGTLILQP
ncbi:MAG TPA: LysR family transcriptional regulator [Pseudomonas sp.]|uniref:LysR family transcriptional regulator n=1 Tax=Pseudomonas sp. TaxID=306 RepID=UPI002EDADF06